MMDPLTAIGLAGNIAQFIDFSCKLFSVSRSIYTSKSGLSNEGEDLQALTINLQSIISKIKLAPSQSSPLNISNELQDLALRCDSIAAELLVVLKKLALKGTNSRWDSFQAALKTIWNKGKIDEMSKRLDAYKSQLILELTKLERDDTRSALVSWFSQLRKENDTMQIQNSHSLRLLKEDILSALNSLRVEMENNKTMQDTYSPSKRGANVSKLAERGQYLTRATEILKSLHFPGMKSRQARVAKAHYQTFQWAWESHFRQWMASDDFLFWVSGKPGSGKSTLMKHVFENPETSALLMQWCSRAPLQMRLEDGSERRLILASYFFWINGDTTQRSQEGLLRSILFDIFRQYPEHVSKLKNFPPDNSNLAITAPWAWTFESCQNLFEDILRQTQETDNYCLFIDGLDEYEGDKAQLIKFIKHLREFPNLKICVASRPWNVFEAAFGQSETNKVYMQKLNEGDIRKYVNDHLEENPEFQMLKSDNGEVQQLVHEIVDKANGVFLWVYLVVKSLLEGLENADRILDLKRRLHAFPSDLNEYFQHILHSLDPIYKVQVVRGFEAALTASKPLSLVHFWYLDREEEEGLEYTLKIPIQSLTQSKAVQRAEARAKIMTKRINGRFKGLLEVTRDAPERPSVNDNEFGRLDNQSEVNFLHRTVRDFLYTSECQQIMSSWRPKDFEVNYSLSLAYLGDLKELLGDGWFYYLQTRLTDLLANIFSHLKDYESKTTRTPGSFYLEFNRILNTPLNERTIYPKLPWEATLGTHQSFSHWIIYYDALGFLKFTYPRFLISLTVEQKWSYLETAIRSRSYQMIDYIASAEPHLELSPSELDASLFDENRFWKDGRRDLWRTLRILSRSSSVCKKKLTDNDIRILIEQNISPDELGEVVESSSIPEDYNEKYLMGLRR